MRLLFAKFFIVIATSFLLAHNLTPHHHHNHIEINTPLEHHDLDDDLDNNIFSFNLLDENYLVSQNNFHLAKRTFLQIFCVYQSFQSIELTFIYSDRIFPVTKEFPPPGILYPTCSHRGPPVV